MGRFTFRSLFENHSYLPLKQLYWRVLFRLYLPPIFTDLPMYTRKAFVLLAGMLCVSFTIVSQSMPNDRYDFPSRAIKSNLRLVGTHTSNRALWVAKPGIEWSGVFKGKSWVTRSAISLELAELNYERTDQNLRYSFGLRPTFHTYKKLASYKHWHAMLEYAVYGEFTGEIFSPNGPTPFATRGAQAAIGLQGGPCLFWVQDWGFLELKTALQVLQVGYVYERTLDPTISIENQRRYLFRFQPASYRALIQFTSFQLGAGFFLPSKSEEET
ncbi:MAG TPA: hypothetical protein DCE41_15285 [Cytophagales bacterium]|nr:hypothetical protein [Cytophagales bacterium]